MENQEKYQSFDFFEEISKKIVEELIKDPINEEKLARIQDEYQNTGKYPKNTFEIIKSAIFHTKELYNDYINIYEANKGEMDNIYEQIFFFKEKSNKMPQGITEEEEEEEEVSDNKIGDSISISVDSDEYIDIIKNTSTTNTNEENNSYTSESLQKRIQEQINQISTRLSISKDLSYLLLKKFNWNERPIIDQWENKIEQMSNILKDLHVPEHMIRDDLKVKKIGLGTCPVCYNDDIELFELYCGHSLCFDCWKGEIEEQLKDVKIKVVPIHCRFVDCGAEIMISDIKRFCGELEANDYKASIINNQTLNDTKIIKCPSPDCPNFINIDSLGSGGVVTCDCGQQACWFCKEKDHTPLKCGKLEEWKNIQNEMDQILREQKDWINREIRCFMYRRNNITEIENIYEEFNKRLLEDHMNANQKELSEIDLLEKKISLVAYDKVYKKVLENAVLQKKIEHELKEKERKNQRELHLNDQRQYIEGLYRFQLIVYDATGNNLSLQYITHEKINDVRKNISKKIESSIIVASEDHNDEVKIKKCPSCNASIQKIGGCNHMTCSRCKHEFCWICGGTWKGKHEPCPLYGKILIKNENNNNNNDNSNSNENSNFNENNNNNDSDSNENGNSNENNNNNDDSDSNENSNSNENNNNNDETISENKVNNANINVNNDEANTFSVFRIIRTIWNKFTKGSNNDENAKNNSNSSNNDSNTNTSENNNTNLNENKINTNTSENNNSNANENNNNANTSENNNNNQNTKYITNNGFIYYYKLFEEYEDDENITDKSFRIPPINSVFLQKYNRWQESIKFYRKYFEKYMREKTQLGSLRKIAYERAKLIFSPDELDEKFNEILHIFDNACRILMYSYPAAYFMDHETGSFLYYQKLLDSLSTTYNEFSNTLYNCPLDKPYGKIIEISKRTDKIIKDILNISGL